MKLAKRFAALIMGATLALGSVVGLAGCGGNTGDNSGTNNTQNGGSQNTVEEQIHAIYDLYVANCAENNMPVQSYEQWFASIQGAKGDKGDPGTNGTNGKSAYELYLDGYALEHGSTDGAPTQAEWLASLKGEEGSQGAPGKDAITPHIGEDDMWWIGEEETGYQAVGKNGVTPHIGSADNGEDEGYWYFGDEKTDYKAVAENGKSAYQLYLDDYEAEHGNTTDALEEDEWLASLKGDKGADGATWHFGNAEPSNSKTPGNFGDLYLNTSNWDVYVKQDNGTANGTWKVLGCLAPMDPLTAQYGKDVNIAENKTDQIDITGLSAGTHYVTAEVDITVGEKSLNSNYEYLKVANAWQLKVDDASYYSLLAEDSGRTREPKSRSRRIYVGFIVVKEGAKKVTVSAGNLPLKARIIIDEETWTLGDWGKLPTSKNTPSSSQLIIPINGYGMAEEDCIKINLPSWGATYGCAYNMLTSYMALSPSTDPSSTDVTDLTSNDFTVTVKAYQDETWEDVTVKFGDETTKNSRSMKGQQVYFIHAQNKTKAQNAIWPVKMRFKRIF